MAKLVLSLNGVVQGEYQLDKERLTIGRKADNDIPIDNLAVSGKHALVITILDDSFLEDLGSTNGSYVNGKLIKKHALKDGDVIAIGKHEMKYVNELATADDDEFEKTMIIKPGSASAAVAAAQAAEKAVASVAPAATRPRRRHAFGPADCFERPHRRKRTGTDEGTYYSRQARNASFRDITQTTGLFSNPYRK